MDSRRSSPLSFQDAQSQAPSSYYTATPQPSIAMDSEDEEDVAGIFFDSMAQKMEFFEQQRQILHQLDIEDCLNLAKHLHIAWLLKTGHINDIQGEQTVKRAIKGDLNNDDIDRMEVDNEGEILALTDGQNEAAGVAKQINGTSQVHRGHIAFYNKWSAWPFPPDLLPVPALEGPSYALRDALFTVLLRQTTLSLRSRNRRKRRYTVSSDDCAAMQLCRPVLQEVLPRVDHLLTTIYRAIQGFLPPSKPKRKKRKIVTVHVHSNKRVKQEASQEEPEIQPPKISQKTKKKLKLLDAQDIFNYCTLLEWPPAVLQASAKRLSKILPQGGFDKISYYSMPENASFPGTSPRRWAQWAPKLPPIVAKPGERSVIIAGEKVDRNTLAAWKRLDYVRDWRNEGGGVTPDGFLEYIPPRKRRLGGNGVKNEKARLARKERLQRVWEEEHGGA